MEWVTRATNIPRDLHFIDLKVITLLLLLGKIGFTRTNRSSITKRPRNRDERFETTFHNCPQKTSISSGIYEESCYGHPLKRILAVPKGNDTLRTPHDPWTTFEHTVGSILVCKVRTPAKEGRSITVWSPVSTLGSEWTLLTGRFLLQRMNSSPSEGLK